MGGKAKAPATPDYRGLAEQEAKSSQEAANQQMYYNRPEVVTPFGGESWEYGTQIDPVSGKEYTTSKQTTTIDPEAQKALEAQLRVQSGRSEMAEGMMGAIGEDYQDPFDTSQYGEYQGLSTDPNTVRQEAFDNMRAYAAPQREQDRSRMETQLANQGITPGSEAYDNAMRQLSDQESRQDLGFQNQAGAEGQRMQGMDVTNADYQNNLRQMQLAEGLGDRGRGLNELNAMLTGQQVGAPEMPGFNQAGRGADTKYLDAGNMQYQGEIDIFNTKQASKDALTSGLMNMGSSAAMMCDIRVKRNLERVGYYEDGIAQYAFQYLWSDEWFVGPVAQEVELVRPELVFEVDGIKHVRIGELH